MPQRARDANAAPRARLRAVAAFACVALGIVLARWHIDLPAAVWFALAAASGAVAYVARGWACRAAFMLGAVALAGGYFTARIDEPARDALARLVPPDAWLTSPTVRVEGALEADPALLATTRTELDTPIDSGPSMLLRLRVTRVQTPDGWTSASGRVSVFLRSASPRWRAGDTVRVTGTLTPAGPASNPGASDSSAYTRMIAWAGRISVPDAALIERADATGARARLRAAWYSARARVRARALRAMGIEPGDPGDALIGSIVLGQPDPVLDPHVEAFRRVGVAHLLAISGFHLAVLAGLALVAIRASGDRGWLEPAFVMLIVLVYVFVLPVKTPVLRAAMMVLLLLGAETAGRRYDRVAVLAWAGIALLIWRPLGLFSIGFQLTMSITAVLLAMGDFERTKRRQDLRRALAPDTPASTMPAWVRVPIRWTYAYARTCVACWLVAAPIVMAHLHVFSPAAPLATMLTMPLVLVSLQLGYLATIVGVIAGPVGWLADLAGWMGGLTVAFVSWTDSLAWTSVRTGAVSSVWACAAAGVAFWVAARARWRDPRAWGAILVLASWAIIEMRTAARPDPGVALRLDTLDVGNGSCHLIRSDDESLLWDAGSLSPNAAKRVIEPALRALGQRSVDAAVITHANLDHFNAMPDLADSMGIETIYTTDAFVRAAEARPRSPHGIALARLRASGVQIKTLCAGDTLELGHATVRVVWPPADLPARGVLSVNDTSLVARISVPTRAGERSALMTGDIQATGIRGVLDALGESAHADVLELPHHGSVSFEAAALVESLDPGVVLQSTGPERAREPAWHGLTRGRAWWVTAEHGAARTRIHHDGSITSGALIPRR